MKLNELKHNHSLTDLLKVILFSILMLAPIGMVATKCLYAVCNKNAYQSYYGETINEINYTQVETYTLNKKYHFVMDGYTTPFNNITSIMFTNVENYTFPSINNSLQNALDNNEVYRLEFNYYNNAALFKLYEEGSSSSLQNFTGNLPFQFDFTLLGYTADTQTMDLFVRNIEYNNYSYLDNVFEYSVSQLEQSPLFNWTQNTAIFSGIQTMTTELGITNQTIPILLTYWFLLTVIYIIIDIILKLFTYMTHALGNRKV